MNGIIIDGKVYESVPNTAFNCNGCNLKDRCDEIDNRCLAEFLFGTDDIFVFSQELTDKINHGHIRE